MTTWKQFKDEVEKQGLKDEMEIDYIDWDGYEEPHVHLDDPTWITID